jgi:Transcriptional regulators
MAISFNYVHSAYGKEMRVPDDLEKLRLENILGAICLAMVDKMERAFADEAGLGPSSAAALIQIGTNPGITTETLRRIIALSHSATVRLVDQLVASGLVLRGDALETDRRAKRLELTEEGEARFRRCLAARRMVTDRAVRALGEEELTQLGALAEKILPAIVDLGVDQDVVCRVCDQEICERSRCPISHMA